MIVAAAVLLGAAVLVLVLGGAVRFGHAYFLISGYNVMTPEERAHVNTRGMAREIGRMCAALAAVMAAAAALMMAHREWGLALMVLVLPIVFVTLWRTQRYNGNACDEEGHVRRQSRATLVAVLAFPTLITIGTLALVFYSARPPDMTVADGELTVSGLYHETIALSDIRSAELLGAMPAVKTRLFGTGLGSRMYGSFRLKDGENVRLYVDSSQPPFIRLTEKDGSVTILNTGRAAKTQELYDRITD